MAFAATDIFEVSDAGSNSNGGGFNPGNANMATDLTTDANTANTASPVVSSASYNFAARDVGHWVFIPTGTNWIPGWYKIASVASNKATLDASIGAACLYTNSVWAGRSTVTGCATVGTPTGGTWTVDYSQSTAIAITDAATASTTTWTSAATPMGKNFVGNIVKGVSGTGWNTTWWEVSSVTTVTATAANFSSGTTIATHPSTGGVLNIGGPLLTWAQLETNKGAVASQLSFLKGAFTIATGVSTAATGNSIGNVRPDFTVGYGTVRGDCVHATITASANITMLTVNTNNYRLENVTFDAADTAAICVSWSGLANAERGFIIANCRATRFATSGFVTGGGTLLRCRVDDAKTGAGQGVNIAGGHYTIMIDCESNVPECHAIAMSGNSGIICFGCIFYKSDVGATKSFINGSSTLNGLLMVNCTLHTSTGTAVLLTGTYFAASILFNNIIYGSLLYGVNISAAIPQSCSFDYNAFGSNSSGHRNLLSPGAHDVTLTGDPCTAVGSGDLSLDNTAGEGAACRNAGYPGAFPGATTTGYLDIGAVRHQDPAGGGVAGPFIHSGSNRAANY